MMKRMFERADADGDGTVSLAEFETAFADRLTTADGDGNGIITAAELAQSLEDQRKERRAERMLRRFDANRDGSVTVEEIRAHASERFGRLDRDGDGAIALSELPRRGGDDRR